MTSHSLERPAGCAVRTPPRRRAALAWMVGLMMLGSAPAGAEKADRAKPTQIESDSMQYDDVKQTTVFTGNVTLTKGTVVIRGDRLVLRQDPEGYQYGTAFGNPATFRQKRDGGEQFVTGLAQQLDYDGKTEIVKFRERAQVKRLDRERVTDEVHGNLIVYDSRSEFISVDSGGAKAATPENPGGRVRVVIQPRSTDAPAPAPVPLKPAERIAPAPVR
ncbi:MAG: lipopolysaccharide transport periplasmic protein LptA [Burkholderiaceae bacterium]|nr:lipopolysaccharide transport periplasmic protein LptA [Burkholderiaceae bacterium]